MYLYVVNSSLNVSSLAANVSCNSFSILSIFILISWISRLNLFLRTTLSFSFFSFKFVNSSRSFSSVRSSYNSEYHSEGGHFHPFLANSVASWLSTFATSIEASFLIASSSTSKFSSESGVGSIAHSVVLIRVKKGANVEAIKEKLEIRELSSAKSQVEYLTTTELNYVDGVTSNIQTQLDAKASGAAVSSDP